MKKQTVGNVLAFVAVMAGTISLEVALQQLSVKEENIYLVFVLAILIIIIETKNIVYGILATIITVLSFNFFITEPKYSFVVDDTNNYVSFFMFIIVALMVNSLVIQLQKQIEISRMNEKKIKALYKFSTEFLHSRTVEEAMNGFSKSLSEETGSETTVMTNDGNVYGHCISEGNYSKEIETAIGRAAVTGPESPGFAGLDAVIFPITSQLRNYGVLIVKPDPKGELDREFIENVIEELVVVLDKNYISTIQEETKIQVEKEKFKTALLRGLSHDLKTPLTMIQSGSDFLYESFDSIIDRDKKELINDIHEESVELSDFVNNLLDITRLDNDVITLNRQYEALDDILSDVMNKVKKRLGNKTVTVNQPEEVIMVNADASLLVQVFVNLIDNAVTHTGENTEIVIDCRKEDGRLMFSVSDNGGGIKGDADRIFDDFYSITANQDARRSHGLGLSICKAIIQAHGGEIMAYNNDNGGATFEFTIVNEGGPHE